jgi:hypothetical protein
MPLGGRRRLWMTLCGALAGRRIASSREGPLQPGVHNLSPTPPLLEGLGSFPPLQPQPETPKALSVLLDRSGFVPPMHCTPKIYGAEAGVLDRVARHRREELFLAPVL